VNLYGSPGAGKSTGAAYLFSRFKMDGINAELVTEFAKDMVWEGSHETLSDQIYIFGQQYHRLSRLKDKVSVVITDSPILLSLFYCNDPSIYEELRALVVKADSQFCKRNYYITRRRTYNPIGRLQTEEESDAIAGQIQSFLTENNICHDMMCGTEEEYDRIYEELLPLVRQHE